MRSKFFSKPFEAQIQIKNILGYRPISFNHFQGACVFVDEHFTSSMQNQIQNKSQKYFVSVASFAFLYTNGKNDTKAEWGGRKITWGNHV